MIKMLKDLIVYTLILTLKCFGFLKSVKWKLYYTLDNTCDKYFCGIWKCLVMIEIDSWNWKIEFSLPFSDGRKTLKIIQVNFLWNFLAQQCGKRNAQTKHWSFSEKAHTGKIRNFWNEITEKKLFFLFPLFFLFLYFLFL